MSREQAKANLVAIGIENPSDEQITNYLNQLGGETKREKERADKYKADSEKMVELQKQLDDLNNANLTEIEKAQKETENANSQIAELQKQIKSFEVKAKLAELGIVGEQAEKLINADGVVDFSVLGQIITERENTASSLKEQEILAKTPNPKGGNRQNGEKTEAEIVAESIGKSMADSNKTATDIIAQYT